jgi:hypothetical protein
LFERHFALGQFRILPGERLTLQLEFPPGSSIGLTVLGEPLPIFWRTRSIVGRRRSCSSASAASQTWASWIPRPASGWVNVVARTFWIHVGLVRNLRTERGQWRRVTSGVLDNY